MSYYYKPYLLSLVLIYFDTFTTALRIVEKYFKFGMNTLRMPLCKTFPVGVGCWWYIVTEAGQLSLLFLHLSDQDNRTVMGQ